MAEEFILGRVFSGKASIIDKIKIFIKKIYEQVKFKKKIQRIFIPLGTILETISTIPSGNLILLVGLDQFILNEATISSEDDNKIRPFKTKTYLFHNNYLVNVY